jgi:hypothetical protein
MVVKSIIILGPRMVILNTNNLPDGEVDRKRFPSAGIFQEPML